MGKNTWVVGLIIIVVLLAGGYMAYRSSRSIPAEPVSLENNLPTSQPTPFAEGSPAASLSLPSQNVVKITGSGFSPKIITIQANQTVTWINDDSAAHQVNSAVHPTHLVYPPLNTVDLVNPTDQKSLSFPTPGTYNYHDHLNPSSTGQVVVK